MIFIKHIQPQIKVVARFLHYKNQYLKFGVEAKVFKKITDKENRI